MTARIRRHCMALLCACLMLADCSALPRRRDAAAGDALPVQVQNSLTMRQLLGHDPKVEPLQPEPGDIWAGVLPTQPPAALTPLPSGHPVSAAPRASPVAAMPSPADRPRPAPAVPPPAAIGPSPAVQLAAADSAQGAVTAWTKLERRLRNLLRGHSPRVTATEIDGRKVWRLRAAGFATVGEAIAFCARLRAAKADCWVVRMSAEH